MPKIKALILEVIIKSSHNNESVIDKTKLCVLYIIFISIHLKLAEHSLYGIQRPSTLETPAQVMGPHPLRVTLNK